MSNIYLYSTRIPSSGPFYPTFRDRYLANYRLKDQIQLSPASEAPTMASQRVQPHKDNMPRRKMASNRKRNFFPSDEDKSDLVEFNVACENAYKREEEMKLILPKAE